MESLYLQSGICKRNWPLYFAHKFILRQKDPKKRTYVNLSKGFDSQKMEGMNRERSMFKHKELLPIKILRRDNK